MHSCEQPSFFLNADVVWIENDTADTMPSEGNVSVTIGELSERFGITPRALRFYEAKGLISPLRDAHARIYNSADCDRLALILKAKKLGFTLAEILEMFKAQEGGDTDLSLKLSRDKCLEQIAMLERQRAEVEEALAELRRIHTVLFAPAASLFVPGR